MRCLNLRLQGSVVSDGPVQGERDQVGRRLVHVVLVEVLFPMSVGDRASIHGQGEVQHRRQLQRRRHSRRRFRSLHQLPSRQGNRSRGALINGTTTFNNNVITSKMRVLKNSLQFIFPSILSHFKIYFLGDMNCITISIHL